MRSSSSCSFRSRSAVCPSPAPAGVVLQRNLLVYGVGGLLAPFVGIKLIDVVLNALGLV